jgi:hypothetical protein
MKRETTFTGIPGILHSYKVEIDGARVGNIFFSEDKEPLFWPLSSMGIFASQLREIADKLDSLGEAQ